MKARFYRDIFIYFTLEGGNRKYIQNFAAATKPTVLVITFILPAITPFSRIS